LTLQDDDDDDDDDDDEDGTATEGDLGLPEETMMKLRQAYRPVIVCVNKVDLVADDDGDNIVEQNNGEKKKKSPSSSVYVNTPAKAVQTIQKWRSALPDAFAILPTCAADGPNDPGVVALRSILLANDPNVDVGSAIRGLGRPLPAMFAATKNMISNEEARAILPVGPPLYHPDFFTDRTDRFCASELIRETLFENLGKELPYCCEVRVETFDESERYAGEDDEDDEDLYGVVKSNNKKNRPLVRIGAMILVERDSQKGIVVGKGGQKIKDVGVEARGKLEEFFGVKVFLDLRVKVDKNWRNNKDKLKQFGYM